MDERYEIRRLKLAHGQQATLIRLPAVPQAPHGAVLHVHGFSDYFFQHHLADHVVAGGRDFYAVDLRRCGRSLRDGEVPHDMTSVDELFEDLDRAVQTMAADGHQQIIVVAHSTGGLVAPLWLDARRGAPATAPVRGLVLNSPWFELDGTRLSRRVADAACAVIGKLHPKAVLSTKTSVYGETVHRSHHGLWDYDLALKPLEDFPVRAGFLRAVRGGQRRLQRGLGVGVPVLVLRSDTSVLGAKAWAPALMAADAILDVQNMTRYAPCLGPAVTVETVAEAMHDVFLSRQDVRDRALAVVDAWLAQVDGT